MLHIRESPPTSHIWGLVLEAILISKLTSDISKNFELTPGTQTPLYGPYYWQASISLDCIVFSWLTCECILFTWWLQYTQGNATLGTLKPDGALSRFLYADVPLRDLEPHPFMNSTPKICCTQQKNPLISTATWFLAFDLELWPLTLNFHPFLVKVKVDPNAKNQSPTSNRSSSRAHSHRQTDRHYQKDYLPASLSCMVNN